MLKIRFTTKSKKFFYAGGKLISMLYCLFAVLFFPYAVTLNLPSYIIIITAFLAIGTPLVLMPLIYDLINSSPLISTGRYHIPLAASTLGIAFFTALMFSGRPEFSFAGNVCRVFFSLFFLTFSFMIFKYVYSSIGSRIFGENDNTLNMSGNVFAGSGVIAFMLMFIFMYNGSVQSISGISYISSIILLFSGFSVILSTYLDIPRFVRVEPPRKRKIKLKYQKFFGSFADRENVKVYLCYFLTGASLIVFFFSAVFIGAQFTSRFEITGGAALVLGLFFIIAAYFFSRAEIKSTGKVIVAASAVQLAAMIFVIIGSYISVRGAAGTACFMAAAALVGAGGGIQLFISRKRFSDVIKRSNSAKGIVSIIYVMLLLLAIIAGLTVLSLAWIAPAHALKIAMPASAAFALASVIFHFTGNKKLTLNLEYAVENPMLDFEEESAIDDNDK